MKLLINTATTFKGGGVQVAKSFIEECLAFPEHEYHVILGKNLSRKVDQKLFTSNFYFYTIDYRPAQRVFSFKDPKKFMVQIEERVNPDVVFTTSGPSYWKPRAPHLCGYNLPHYIYPESPFFDKISLYRKLRFYLKEKTVFYFFNRDVTAFVVQTEDVNRRLGKKLPKAEIYTVSNTASKYYLNPQRTLNKLPSKKENEFRLLTLSAYYMHKGIDIIPKVIEELIKKEILNIRFVLTIGKAEYKTIIPNHLRKYVYNVGPVAIDECASLYQECDVMFLPTLLECFSASYVEAMIMKKPIITSNLGFARTVCKDAAIYVDALNPEQIANNIFKIYTNKKLYKKLIDLGSERIKAFNSSKERAKKYLNICENLLIR